MAYSVKADVLLLIDEERLIELTDDEDLNEVNDARITEAIAQADSEIDGYIATQQTVPISPVPGLVKKFSVDIAIYNLYSRRAEEIPQTRDDRYRNAIRQLEEIAKGTITLGDVTGVTEPDSIEVNTVYPDDRTFTKGLDGETDSGSMDNF